MTPTRTHDNISHMPTSMLKYGYHYCHMAINVLKLPYGNERGMNDGRRPSPVTQRAWMELIQTQTARTRVSVCSEVEEGRDLHHIINQVAGTDRRRSSEEDRGCVRVAGIFSVATQSASNRVETIDANCWASLLHVHYTRNGVIWQRRVNGFVVAGRGEVLPQ